MKAPGSPGLRLLAGLTALVLIAHALVLQEASLSLSPGDGPPPAVAMSTRTVPLPGGGEPRCALEVTLAADGGLPRLTVVSTHLDVSSAESRASHAKQLAADLAKRPELVLLGGDFNATPDAPPLVAFGSPWLKPAKHGANTATIPSAEPVREIDFILIKPATDAAAPAVKDYRVIEEKVASDHRPIVMALEFPAAK